MTRSEAAQAHARPLKPHVPGTIARSPLPVLLILLLGALAPVGAAASATARKLGAIIDRAERPGCTITACVVDLERGHVLYQRNAARPMVPASNMKLVTMAAALGVLGPEYHFRTVVALRGPDLVVIGGGDPAIGAPFADHDPESDFRQWAVHLRQRGIREVRDVILDDHHFDREFFHRNWPIDQRHRGYQAPVGALALHGNCVQVAVTPARPGTAARVALVPEQQAVVASGRVSTVASVKQHRWSAYRRPGSNQVLLSGRFYSKAAPSVATVTVNDPTRFFGEVLLRVLREQGIHVTGRLRRQEVRAGSAGDDLPQVIHQTRLVSLLPVMGKESNNFVAEQVFKTLGATGSSSLGTWRSGRETVLRFLQRNGLPTAGLWIDDGSGLSPDNRATAVFFARLLQVMDRSPQAALFRESLAEAGSDGTLERRLTHESTRHRIHAKTGTLSEVRTLSGYADTVDGRRLSFSLLMNGPVANGRALQAEFCRTLVDDERG